MSFEICWWIYLDSISIEFVLVKQLAWLYLILVLGLCQIELNFDGDLNSIWNSWKMIAIERRGADGCHSNFYERRQRRFLELVFLFF